MTDNVVKFYPSNAAKDPDNVLEQAIGEYAEIFVVGIDKEGMLDARASLGLKSSDILFLIEQFKHNLLSGAYSERLEDE